MSTLGFITKENARLKTVLSGPVADPRGRIRRPFPTAQKFLNVMQFFGFFGKITCWRPRMVGVPCYGEYWTRPCGRSVGHNFKRSCVNWQSLAKNVIEMSWS